jgi:hypothetical protein
LSWVFSLALGIKPEREIRDAADVQDRSASMLAKESWPQWMKIEYSLYIAFGISDLSYLKTLSTYA